MNTFQTALRRAILPALALPLLALGLAACDVESVDSTTANVADNDGTIYNFAGLYANSTTNGLAPLVFPTNKQSGVPLTWLRLLQYGSVIEAYDNAGMTWAGSISTIEGGTANFSLRGRTTAGLSTEIAGTLVYADQQSVMDAAWIEPAFSGNLYAIATVAPSTTNSPSGNLELAVDDSTVSSNQTVNLTASGGSGAYTWPSSVSYGTFSGSGSSATYTRTSGTSGEFVIITVSSGSESDSVSLFFN
jgi:hypothetical protein